MTLAAHFFFLQMAAGIAAWTFMVSLKSVGRGFYQLHVATAFVALASSLVDQGGGLAALWAKRGLGDLPGWWAAFQLWATFGSGALLMLGCFAYSWRERLALWLHAGGALACCALFVAELGLLGRAARWPASEWAGEWAGPALFVVSGALGATVLALATLAMNIGHWFLMNPRLGIGHLERPSRLLFWVMVARGGTLAAAALATWSLADVEGMSLSGAILAYGFFEGSRTLAGWAAPTALAWMAVQTARIRSTQAATGILYALLLMVAIGEGLAWLLAISRLIPW